MRMLIVTLLIAAAGLSLTSSATAVTRTTPRLGAAEQQEVRSWANVIRVHQKKVTLAAADAELAVKNEILGCPRPAGVSSDDLQEAELFSYLLRFIADVGVSARETMLQTSGRLRSFDLRASALRRWRAGQVRYLGRWVTIADSATLPRDVCGLVKKSVEVMAKSSDSQTDEQEEAMIRELITATGVRSTAATFKAYMGIIESIFSDYRARVAVDGRNFLSERGMYGAANQIFALDAF